MHYFLTFYSTVRKLNSPHNQHYCPFFFAFRSYGKSEEFPFYVVELYANEDDTRKKFSHFKTLQEIDENPLYFVFLQTQYKFFFLKIKSLKFFCYM